MALKAPFPYFGGKATVAHREDVDFCRKNVVNAPPVYPAPTLAEWVSRHGIKGGDKDEYLQRLMAI